MKTIGIPAVFLVLFSIAFLAGVGASAQVLPERVASHFNGRGQPDGWMSRNGYLTFIALMGLGLPLFIVGLSYLSRFLPDQMVNLPNKQYWLSPQFRDQTHNYLVAQCMWLGCLVLAHFGGMHFLTVLANRRSPVALPGTGLLVISIAFVALLAVWIFVLFRRFRRPA